MDEQQRFIQERVYLKSVTPATVQWYKSAFIAFAGAIDNRADAIERIGVLKERGLAVVSINCHLRVVKAFWKWKGNEGKDWKIPKLKEEQKILATFSPEQVSRLVHWKAVGRNEARAHIVALVALDTGLRISEILGLTRQNVDLDNLILRVNGKAKNNDSYQ